MSFSVSNSLLKWVPCVMLGGVIFLHYYCQNQLTYGQSTIENLKLKLVTMKNGRHEVHDHTWDLLKNVCSNQKALKYFLRTIALSPAITIHDIHIKNEKWSLIASSQDLNSPVVFANGLQHAVIKSIKWDSLSHSVIFQVTSDNE